MYKYSKLAMMAAFSAVVAVGTVGVTSQSAYAGLESSKKSADKSGKTKPTKIKSMARIPDKVAGNVFKCWQEGRLIFSRSGMNVGADKLPGATKITAGAKTLQVLDLKQGMCILDQTK